jgi:hypothetical protein
MFVFLTFACSSSPPAEEPAPTEPAEVHAEPGGTPLDSHMQEHFRDATIAMEAWVGAKFDVADKHLAYLAKHPAAKGLPEGTTPHVEAMQEAAARAAAPAPPTKTAEAYADLGVACGACHAAANVSVEIELDEPPPASDNVQTHMVGHLWGVRALWSGLVSNDDALYTRGATYLAGDALHQGSFGMIDELPENLQAEAEAVHAGGRAAAVATTPEARRAAFVGIVSACGNCHSEMRGE